jgi:8-oxo-dGTP pyrophosphatase MutT (NUDIX family)
MVQFAWLEIHYAGLVQVPFFIRRLGLIFGLGTKALMSPVAFGVNAIVDDADGRVVLVRQTYMQGLHLPGGGVSAGEPPGEAIMRELREEIGLVSSAPPEFVGLYTRQFGFVTNVVALYRVRDAIFNFKPNFEIREIALVDPNSPPDEVRPGTRRRLQEMTGTRSISPYW